MKRKVRIYAAAKINLFLEVFDKLKNSNYHNINSVFQSVGIYDILDININKNSSDISLYGLYGSSFFDKNPSNNTSYLAAKFFLEELNYKIGVNIFCKKNIPICAGLGGASADAAATLLGLNALFENVFSNQKLFEIAVKIGADVPFCLEGGCCFAQGIGEFLKKIDLKILFFLVIIKPNYDASTKKMYELIDKKKLKTKTPDNILNALKKQDLNLISKNLYNKFEEILEFKEILKIKNDLTKHGAINALMTGSGSAIYGIFKKESEALICTKKLSKKYQNIFCTKSTNFSNLLSVCTN